MEDTTGSAIDMRDRLAASNASPISTENAFCGSMIVRGGASYEGIIRRPIPQNDAQAHVIDHHEAVT